MAMSNGKKLAAGIIIGGVATFLLLRSRNTLRLSSGSDDNETIDPPPGGTKVRIYEGENNSRKKNPVINKKIWIS